MNVNVSEFTLRTLLCVSNYTRHVFYCAVYYIYYSLSVYTDIVVY